MSASDWVSSARCFGMACGWPSLGDVVIWTCRRSSILGHIKRRF
jgi:hypothetical protein